MRTAWFIHNPAAGRFSSDRIVARAAEVMRGFGWSVRLNTARQGDHLRALVRDAREAEADAVIVAGGDGTVGLAASELNGSRVALGVFPTGTSNVWAKDLRIPQVGWSRMRSAEQIATLLAKADILPADVGEANGRPFLLWAGTGLDARVVNLIEPRRKFEKLLPTTLYVIHTLRSATNWHGVDLEVQWAGGRVSGRFIVAVASNIASYGGGLLHLAPEARINDGLLDFWLLEGQSVRETVVRLLDILFRRHLTRPGFVHFQTDWAEFRGDGHLPMHFDGEPGQVESPVRFRARPNALRVLVPRALRTSLFASATTGTEAAG